MTKLTPYGLEQDAARLMAKVGSGGKVMAEPEGFASVLPRTRRVVRRSTTD